MCLLSCGNEIKSELCVTGKGLPLLLIDDVLLARTEYGAARLTVIARDALLVEIEQILAREVFDVLDKSIYETLNAITLEDLLTALNREESNENLMYFI